MASRRTGLSATGRPPLRWAVRMVASNPWIASGMHAARSRARASYSRSAAGLPGNRILREMTDLTRHPPAEQVVERQQVRDDVEIVVCVGDPLRQQVAELTAIRIAHAEHSRRH